MSSLKLISKAPLFLDNHDIHQCLNLTKIGLKRMYTGEQSDYIGRGLNLTKIFETILSLSIDLLLAFPIVGHLEMSNKAQFS